MMRAVALLLCLSAQALAQVDVVVVDKDGRRVPDLTAADFTALQDGKPRPIKQFTYVPEQPGSSIAVLVDDLAMNAAEFAAARQAIARFTGAAAVVCLSGRSGAHLERALDRMYWRPPAPVITLLGDIPLAPELRDIVIDLGRTPGRKSLAVMAPAPHGARSLDVRAMAELANRLSVAVYNFGGSEGIAALAATTGGWPIHQLEDASAAPYYEIGWDPGEGTDYHRVQIRVRDKKLQVHARDGFAPHMSASLIASAPPVSEKMRRALASPLGGGDLDVTLTAGFVRHEAAGSYVDLLMHIGAKGLRLEPDGNGCGRARLEVMRALWPLDPGLPPSDRVSTDPLEVTACGQDGIVATVRERVPSPGAYQARVAVRNLADRTGRIPIGSATHFLLIPDLVKEPLALSAPTLWSGAAPPPPAGDLMAGPSRDTHPAVRRFPEGGTLRYAVEVFGAADDIRVRILREGREVHAVAGAASGSIPLTGLSPGHYAFQISATRKGVHADQFLDFEIQ